MRPVLQVSYHDHCFDGVASAATFVRFYRTRIRSMDDDKLSLYGLSHKPGSPFSEDAFAGDENAIVDFRYSPDPRMTWWFDHHQSAFETEELQEQFFRRASEMKFWDPTAKSCTKFIAKTCTKKFLFKPGPLAELIDWAETIDGALFPNAKMAVELNEPAMRMMLLIEATRDPGLLPKLILDLSKRPLSTVAAEPYVTEPLQLLLARHREIVSTVGERIRMEGPVATFDVADLGLDNVNKFIAYDKHPEAVYTVSVSQSSSRCKVSLGSNPWKQELRKHNLAKMAEKFGGGGHAAVAAMSFAPDKLDDARAAAKTLIAELQS